METTTKQQVRKLQDEIKDVLKEIKNKTRFTQQEISDKANISGGTLSNACSYKEVMRISTASNLLNALKRYLKEVNGEEKVISNAKSINVNWENYSTDELKRNINLIIEVMTSRDVAFEIKQVHTYIIL